MRISNAPSPAAVDVLSLLCSQRGALHSVGIRLRDAGAELAPPGTDGWRGQAESAQAALVARLRAQVESVSLVLETARDLTEAAIWSMPGGD
jgi:hypothetical protein